ncbi:hypothetical protein ACF0H5_005972 [Mactra antiquata]
MSDDKEKSLVYSSSETKQVADRDASRQSDVTNDLESALDERIESFGSKDCVGDAQLLDSHQAVENVTYSDWTDEEDDFDFAVKKQECEHHVSDENDEEDDFPVVDNHQEDVCYVAETDESEEENIVDDSVCEESEDDNYHVEDSDSDDIPEDYTSDKEDVVEEILDEGSHDNQDETGEEKNSTNVSNDSDHNIIEHDDSKDDNKSSGVVEDEVVIV